MNVLKTYGLNFSNIKIINSSFVHQNPISFKGNEQDKVEFSTNARKQRTLASLEKDREYFLSNLSANRVKIDELENDISIMEAITKDIQYSDEEAHNIIFSSHKKRQKGFDELAQELLIIFEPKLKEFSFLSRSSMFDFVHMVRKKFSQTYYLEGDGKYISSSFVEIAKEMLDDMRPRLERARLNLSNCSEMISKIDKSIANIKYNPNLYALYDALSFKNDDERYEYAKNTDCLIDLDANEDMSLEAKKIIFQYLDKISFNRKSHVINNQQNNEFLAQFEGCSVFSKEELEDRYGILGFQTLFLNSFVVRAGDKELVSIFKGDVGSQVLSDIKNQKVIASHILADDLKIDLNSLPLVYKKYTLVDEPQQVDFSFVDLTNESNKKILEASAKYRNLLSQLPFERTQMPWGSVIDMRNENNIELLKDTHHLYPFKSEYAYEGLGLPNYSKVEVPVEALEKLGFSKADVLKGLVENGKLDGNTTPQGKTLVVFDTKNRLGKNKNLDILYSLRSQNPHIKTFKEVARALKISHERLEFAIFSGDFEIIDEYINTSDREIRYINIATPKNQEFIRKVKFEQELERQISEAQREERKQSKIEKQDLRQRLAGVRMALAWEFMPNTKNIASMLASNDGHVAKLLAKEDDPNQILTNLEEAKINAFRKEVWLQAGTDELNEAHKKASLIMKTFKEEGLGAVDGKYLPIFERYGFILA